MKFVSPEIELYLDSEDVDILMLSGKGGVDDSNDEVNPSNVLNW